MGLNFWDVQRIANSASQSSGVVCEQFRPLHIQCSDRSLMCVDFLHRLYFARNKLNLICTCRIVLKERNAKMCSGFYLVLVVEEQTSQILGNCFGLQDQCITKCISCEFLPLLYFDLY